MWSTSWTLDAVIRSSRRLFQTNGLLWGKVDFSINLICSGQSFNSCTDFTSFSVWWYFWSRGLFGERIHYNQQIKLIPQVLICLEFDSTFQETFLLWSCRWHKSFSRWILLQLSGVLIKFYAFLFWCQIFFLQNHCSIYKKHQYGLPLWYNPGKQLLQFWTLHQHVNMIPLTWQKMNRN